MLYLGADHGGFELKEQLKGYLDEQGIKYQDLGNTQHDPQDDYPVFANAVAAKVHEQPGDNHGILFCRTGVGMNLIADKFDNVRAVLGFNDDQVRRARGDEGVNVLTIASDFTSFDELKARVKAFLDTPFSGEARHQRRLQQLEDIEDKNFKKATRDCNCENCQCK